MRNCKEQFLEIFHIRRNYRVATFGVAFSSKLS